MSSIPGAAVAAAAAENERASEKREEGMGEDVWAEGELSRGPNGRRTREGWDAREEGEVPEANLLPGLPPPRGEAITGESRPNVGR